MVSSVRKWQWMSGERSWDGPRASPREKGTRTEPRECPIWEAGGKRVMKGLSEAEGDLGQASEKPRWVPELQVQPHVKTMALLWALPS